MSTMLENQSLGQIGGEQTVNATLMILMIANQEMLFTFTGDIGVGWGLQKNGVMVKEPNQPMSCVLSTWMTKYSQTPALLSCSVFKQDLVSSIGTINEIEK